MCLYLLWYRLRWPCREYNHDVFVVRPAVLDTKHSKIFWLPPNICNMIIPSAEFAINKHSAQQFGKVEYWHTITEKCFCSLQCIFAVSLDAWISLFVPKMWMHSENIKVANLLMRSWKGRAIPLLTLWASVACYREKLLPLP